VSRHQCRTFLITSYLFLINLQTWSTARSSRCGTTTCRQKLPSHERTTTHRY
jgi:hypothetical protein